MNEDTALQLQAPRGDERLVGAVFTSFAFEARFFEEEVLTTLAGLPVGYGESMRASSELHEWMLSVEHGIAVVIDERAFTGGRLLGGYDLELAQAPPTFHPKVSLTIWEKSSGARTVRGTVGSCNLTSQGFRRNAEVVASMDGSHRRDRQLLRDLTEYLELVRPRGSSLLRAARAALGQTGPSERRLVVSRRKPMLNAMFDELGADERVRSAIVVSPYFERNADGATFGVMETWCSEVLARASSDFRGLKFYVPPNFDAHGLRVDIPIARAEELAGAENVTLLAVDALWPASADSNEQVLRGLHAKLLCLETTRRCLVLAGSANFSNAALLSAGAAANWEASVLMSLVGGSSERLVPVAATEQDPADVHFVEPEPDPAPPPLIFRSVTYHAALMELYVEPAMTVAPEHWELFLDGTRLAEGPAGPVSSTRVRLERHPVEYALEIRTAEGLRHLPLEVLDKENLPLPGRRAQPSGDDVLDYFAGLRTPGQHDAEQEELDAHASPAREELPAIVHLSRFSQALFGLRAHLERPARSELEYCSRWTGPWGANKLLHALSERFIAGIDDLAYSLFETWELEEAFRSLRLADDTHCSAESKEAQRRAAVEETTTLRRRVERGVQDDAVVQLLTREYAAR